MAKEHERKLPAAGGAGSGGGSSAAGGGRDIGLELSERIGAPSSPSSTSPYSPGSIEYGATSAAEVAGRMARESAGTHEGYRVVAAGGGGIVSASAAGIEELSIEAIMLKDALASKDVEAEYEAILALAAKKEKDGLFYEAAGLLNYALNLCRASELDDYRRKKEQIPDEKCTLRDSEKRKRVLKSRLEDLESVQFSSLGIETVSEEQKYESTSLLYKRQLFEIRSFALSELEKIDQNFPVIYKGRGELGSEERDNEYFKAEAIRVLFKDISLKMKDLAKQILQDCMELLGDSPCEYAIVCFGSMARNEMTPYSDFEWGILVEREDEEVINYFTKLARLMQFRMINLGETILPALHIKELRQICFFDDVTPRGFSMDGLMISACKWPLGNYHIEGIGDDKKFKLLGLPATFADLYSERWWDNDRHLTTVLETVQTIHFSERGERLLTEFNSMANEYLDMVVGDITLRKQRGLCLLKEAVYEHKDCGGKHDRGGHYYDVKKNLYRVPNTLIDSFCIYIGIKGISLWDKLECFRATMLLLEEIGYKNLYSVSSIVLGWRLNAYLEKGCQRDEVVSMEDDMKVTGALKGVIRISTEEFLRVQYTLRQLLNQLEAFCANVNWWNPKEEYYNNSPFSRSLEYHLSMDYDLALENYSRTLESLKSSPMEDYKSIAATLGNIAGIYDKLGKYGDALELFNQALEIQKAHFGENSSSIALTLGNIAGVYSSQGEYKRALEFYNRALKKQSSKLGNCHPDIATTLGNIGLLHWRQGDYEESLKCYTESLKILEKELGGEHLNVATILGNIGLVYSGQGEFERALECYSQALAIKTRKLGEHHPDVATTLANIAGIYDIKQDFEKALEYYGQALQIKKRKLGFSHHEVASTLSNMGLVYFGRGIYEKALELYDEALELLTGQFTSDHPDMATILGNKAAVYHKMGDYEIAKDLYTRALDIKLTKLGEANPEVAILLLNISLLENDRKNFSQGLLSAYRSAKIINLQKNHRLKDKILGNYFATLKQLILVLGNDADGSLINRLGGALLILEQSDITSHNTYLQPYESAGDIEDRLTLLTLAEYFAEHSEEGVSKDELVVIYHNLACYYHVNAIQKGREGDVEKYLEYLAKAEERFNKGLRLLEDVENKSIRVEYANFLVRNDRIDEAREQLERVVRNGDFEGGLSYGVDELEVVDEIIKEEILKTGMGELNAQIFGKYLLIKILHNKGELEERDRLIANLKESVDRTSHNNIHKKMYCEVLRLAGRIEEADRYTDGIVERAIDLSAALAAACAGGGGAVGGARASTIISSGDIISASRRDLNEREEESVAIFISLGDRAERIINTLIRSWRTRHAEGSRAREEDGGSISR